MINQEGPATKHKATMKDVKLFLKEPNNDAPVILAVVENEEDPIYKLFLETNNNVRDDYSFGHTFAEEAKKYFGLKKSAILLVQPEHLQSKHEPKQHVFKVTFYIFFTSHLLLLKHLYIEYFFYIHMSKLSKLSCSHCH